jgi:hypothetical protein
MKAYLLLAALTLTTIATWALYFALQHTPGMTVNPQPERHNVETKRSTHTIHPRAWECKGVWECACRWCGDLEGKEY